MAKLGIIGGMGPLASQLLYKWIIEKTLAERDQDHIDMIILNHAGIPDRTAAIISNDTTEVFAALSGDVHMLTQNGATAIAIPCNTSHYFIDRLQAETDVPIINMIAETVSRIKLPFGTKVGVLATDGTLFSGIYRHECEKHGYEYVAPEPDIQRHVMSIIYDYIKKGIDADPAEFALIDAHLRKRGCKAAILACTELSCYREHHSLTDFYIDAMDVLCEESILACGKELRKDEKI